MHASRQPSNKRTTGRQRRTKVNISEVAQLAEVSIATVSRVVNGSQNVAPELAERVNKAVAELGFRPNAAAQGLASGRTKTLGVLVPDLANPYFGHVLKGITAAANVSSYRTIVADSNERPDEEESLARELFFQVDGLVLCSPRMSGDALKRMTDEFGDRLVLVNRRAPRDAVSSVSIDAGAGMRALSELLVSHGHQRIGFLAGPESSRSNLDRWEAVRGVFGENAIFVPCGSTIEAGYRAVDEALKHQPTALMAFNDLVAIGSLGRLRELGISVPGELSVTGFDDVPAAAHLDPALTTVATDTLRLGTLAWELLERQLSSEGATTVSSVVPRLVERASVGAPVGDQTTTSVAS